MKILFMCTFSDVGRNKISKYSPLLISADWFILVSHHLSWDTVSVLRVVLVPVAIRCHGLVLSA